MTILCAWCQSVIEQRPDKWGPDSHGICASCADKQLSEDAVTRVRPARDCENRRETPASGGVVKPLGAGTSFTDNQIKP